jgi:PAS domain-containing protein
MFERHFMSIPQVVAANAALPPAVVHLASEQFGVMSRAQLLESGLSADQVLAQVESGRWRQVNEAVIVLHNGPLTGEQREVTVILSAAGVVALGGLTAAARCGLKGFETDTVHVLIQRGAKLLETPGIETAVHESRRFYASDIRYFGVAKRVGAARALLDAAVWSELDRRAALILVAGVQQRLVTVRQLAQELNKAGKVRHCRVLRLLLNDLGGGALALSEVEFLRFCARNGFPRPALNVRCDAQGRRRYLDAEFRRADGRLEAVEVDGGVHLSLTQRWLDDLRSNDLYLSGRAGLRFPSVAIYTDDPRAVRQLRQALNS